MGERHSRANIFIQSHLTLPPLIHYFTILDNFTGDAERHERGGATSLIILITILTRGEKHLNKHDIQILSPQSLKPIYFIFVLL